MEWRLLLILLSVLIAIWLVAGQNRKMMWVKASNGKEYWVKNMPGSAQVAERLAYMEIKLRAFIKSAMKIYTCEPGLKRIKDRWNGTLSEIDVVTSNDVAYTVGKRTVAVCVRDKNGDLGDVETCMFVLIHELAHIATEEYGHTPAFWAHMRFLLEAAEETKFYTYQAFEKAPQPYCGHAISTSPLTCLKKKTCTSEALKRTCSVNATPEPKA